MALVKFVNHDGNVREVHVEPGTSLMRAAADIGIEEIVAACSGSCSCGTCHCYIRGEWFRKSGNISSMEKDMLEFVLEPQPESRLSCQVVVTEELDGIVVHLPQAQCA